VEQEDVGHQLTIAYNIVLVWHLESKYSILQTNNFLYWKYP